MFETLHPVVVHFPIGLLVTYSVLEIISLIPRVRNNINVWYIKLFLVVIGWLFIQLALSSGEAAADAGKGVRDILEWHEIFANGSTWIYGIISIGYILKWYITDLQSTIIGMKIAQSPLHNVIVWISKIMSNYYILFLLAIAGIAALSITGALGGAMVYGPDSDPMVTLIMDILQIEK